jgi:phosphate transport system permease protein
MAATGVALLALLAILGTLVVKGIAGFPQCLHAGSGRARYARRPAQRHARLAELCALAMALSVLIGVLAGTWLAEYGEGKRLADVVRF